MLKNKQNADKVPVMMDFTRKRTIITEIKDKAGKVIKNDSTPKICFFIGEKRICLCAALQIQYGFNKRDKVPWLCKEG